ncbi:MAG: M28 family peptidase [Candidatus Heimdallarchaeota archaeon]|nr:MAG: M28 family peptidase [Candidatus Heimdallarchaeota archaeon]
MEDSKHRIDPSGQRMIDFIQRIFDEVGPRLAGSEEEMKAGNIIQEELSTFCDEVIQEKFSCRPGGFLDFIWITALFYLAGILAYFLIHPLISSLLIFLALAVYIVQLNLLYEVIDILFPKKVEFHIVGKIKPQKESRNLVLLSGHHDSAYEFPLLSKLGEKSAIIIIAAVVIALLSIFLGVLRTVIQISLDLSSSQVDPFVFLQTTQNLTFVNVIDTIQIIIFPIGAILVIILAFFLRSNKVVFGANDNLTAVAAILECGKFISQNKLKYTEIWLISFAGEEHMRGSKRFVSQHYEELKQRQALLLNLECLSADKFLVATAENMYLAKHSPLVFEKVSQAAKRVRVPVEVGPLRFAGSDAANFSRKGLHATTIFGLSTTGVPDYWHTLNDTPDKLSGPSIAKGAEIVLQFVYDVDSFG